jgi:iron complex outermembrane recepter protein
MKKIAGANLRTLLLVGAASVACMPNLAIAQDAEEEAAPEEKLIVVTGTLIRGTAPVGSNAISLGQEKLAETGAQSSNELLASIPQVTNYFNRVPVSDLAIAVNQIQISRPNLRNISGSNAASSATLILVDGHRIASAGVNQASIDPDLIPTGAIERVEVVTEGGSATYGADAVAGVINFITRKKFDGFKVGGHYGFAKNYWQYDAGITAGKSWDNGSAYVSYSYTKNDHLLGKERDYIHNLDYSSQPYRGRDVNCAQPNLSVNRVLTLFGATISSTSYAAPGFVAGTSNRCDNSQEATIVPKAERHGVLGGLNWNFGDSTELDIRAYWGQRKTKASGILDGSVTVNDGNPHASSLPAGLALGLQPFTIFGSPVVDQAAVNFNLLPLNLHNSSTTDVSEWGANAELKHDLNDNWQVRALANWSQSDSGYQLTSLNQAALNSAGAPVAPAGSPAYSRTNPAPLATSFNPFNVANNNPTLLAALMNNELAGQAKDNLLQLRALVEGKLFELPGGNVRVAVGYEYMKDKLKKRFRSGIPIGTLNATPFDSYSRNVHSFFGEVVAPLISDGDGGAMLTLSGSGRYDKYSDFGSTFNPKLGATFEPIKGFRFRGNWGTSFTAPTPVDQLGSLSSTLQSFPFVPFQPTPAVALPPGSNNTIALQGSRPNLGPQEADTWSLGVDVEPTKGLRASISYYNVAFTNVLGTPTPSGAIFTDFPDNAQISASGFTATQINNFFTQNGANPLSASLQTQLNNAIASVGGGRVAELVDFRVGNFGIVKVQGVDFDLSITQDIGIGALDVNLNANVPMSRKQQVSPTSTVVDVQRLDNPELYLKAGLGFGSGGFYALATWNHTDGYNILPTPSVPVQTHVGSFNTVDLFFKYDLPGEGIFKDLSFTLNIDNVFDQDPPVLLRNNPNDTGFGNGFTLGRLFNFGVSKKF